MQTENTTGTETQNRVRQVTRLICRKLGRRYVREPSGNSITCKRLPLPDLDRRRSTAEVPLRSDDLVVMSAQLQAELGPRIEVVPNRDGPAGALGRADGPELVEGPGALDGRLVNAGGLVDVVGSAIALHGADERGRAAGVERAVGLDDVVLDEGALGPAVDGEVAVAVRLVVGCVWNGANSAWVPSFSPDKVALVARPANAVLAGRLVGVRDVCLAIGPPGIVESVVGTSGTGGSSTREDVDAFCGVGWKSKRTHEGAREEDRAEEFHVR